jgi:putative endonuclease
MNSSLPTIDIGGRAEQSAAEYLTRLGYVIVERNYRRRHCEIDIVARRGETIFFVEVKYRADDHFGGGYATIGPDKLRRMARAAETWVRERAWHGEYTLSAMDVGGPRYEILDFIESVL